MLVEVRAQPGSVIEHASELGWEDRRSPAASEQEQMGTSDSTIASRRCILGEQLAEDHPVEPSRWRDWVGGVQVDHEHALRAASAMEAAIRASPWTHLRREAPTQHHAPGSEARGPSLSMTLSFSYSHAAPACPCARPPDVSRSPGPGYRPDGVSSRSARFRARLRPALTLYRSCSRFISTVDCSLRAALGSHGKMPRPRGGRRNHRPVPDTLSRAASC